MNWDRLANILDVFRLCAHCGHKAKHQYILCTVCSDRLEGLSLRGEALFERRGELRVYSLWDWHEELIISNFLQALKIKEDPLKLWFGLALSFLARRKELNGSLPFRSIIIPPSSRTGWNKDHASHFGESLSELLGVPCLQLLRPEILRPQKSLGLGERKRKVYQPLQHRFHFKQKYKPTIWADDVLTTGYTARAAMTALKLSPAEVELWCLVRRRTLASW